MVLVQVLVVHSLATFLCRYKQEFGFVIPGRKILVDDVRIRGIGRTHIDMEQTIPYVSDEPVSDMVGVHSVCQPIAFSPLWFYDIVL